MTRIGVRAIHLVSSMHAVVIPMLKQKNPGLTLTPTEAADRVAHRHRGRALAEAEGDDPRYCCEQCGGDQFIVEFLLRTELTTEAALDCECGEYEVAAVEATRTSELEAVSYWLDETHHFSEHLDTEHLDMEHEVSCHQCLEEAGDDRSLWDESGPAPEYTEETIESVTVRCGRCAHEIEFGWSHPDRGGRIWPCEAVDFNPWKSWPEPRFQEDWRRRGWLRPG